MPDQTDPLRSAFAELRSSALPSMRAPGVDAVTTTVRRRRNTRASVAACAVLAVTAAGLWAGGLSHHGSTPYKRPTTLETPAQSGAPSGSPAPSEFPSPSLPPSAPIASGSTGAGSTPRAGRTTTSHPKATHGPVGTTPTAKAQCVSDGIAVADGPDQERFESLTPKQEPLCSGVDIKLFYATYTVNPDGSGSLDYTGEAFLTRQHPSLPVPVTAPSTCATVFVGYGWVTIPGSISADVMSAGFQPSADGPFWDSAHGRSALTSDSTLPCPSAAP